MGLYNALDNIICHNWHCGQITALFAWSNKCTIEDKNEQKKIRAALNKLGYKGRFSGGILTICKTI